MIGYLFAILIGFSLGLMGGGGSILTVPVLVYILKMDAKVSIALSLAIVGFTSLVGVFSHYRKKNIQFSTIGLFAPSTMLGSFVGAYFSQYIPGEVQLTIFAVVMLISSVLMIKGRSEGQSKQSGNKKIALIISGFIVGIISGIVGVGGGFLIVPALVLLAGLEMRKAVGTSLAVISLSSLTGFAGYVGQVEIPWSFLFYFIIFSSIGILIGTKLSSHVSQKKLKRGFGFFLIIMGALILYKNIAI